MDEFPKKYFIKVQDILVEVSCEVYTAYYSMDRRERYLIERDKVYGLLYYDAWSSETTNGVDYINDTSVNVEEEALRNLLPDIWSYVDQIGDKYNICRLIAVGKKEKEIAEIFGITQQTVNETKQRLFKKLKNILEKNLKEI